MSIYISNSLFLNSLMGSDFNVNNPIIGWHSVLRPQDITASESPAPGRPAVNMWAPDTATMWQGNSFAGDPALIGTTVSLTNPGLVAVDYIGIARHNFGTGGYTITVQHSPSGSGLDWTNVTTPRIVNTNDAIIFYFNALSSPLFRIKLEKLTSYYIAPIIAHIKMGIALVLQRRIYVGHKPATIAKRTRNITLGSENGQYLGQINVRSFYVDSIQQQNNTPVFVRQKIKPFIRHLNGDDVSNNTAQATFFFSWRPADYPEEITYCWAIEKPEPENQANDAMGGRMSWSMTMEAVA